MLLIESKNQEKYISDYLEVDLPDIVHEVISDQKSDKSSRSLFKQDRKNDDASQRSSFSLKQRLYLEDIHNLIPERAPGLRITKAAICEIEGSLSIIAPFYVSEVDCEGHMPGFPFLPLAEAGRVLAQAGAILVSYHAKVVENKSDWMTPLVYKVGEVLSGQQGYLFPNNTVCIIATIKKLRGPLYSTECHGYLDKKHIFSMPKIQYFLSDDSRLWRGIKSV
ncbi:hypothetical protein [Lyngbya confervoides]|uniref:Uncharacterized protein n=1 Tax=Lyngbya confervoides BDU141951 TaxID=1574623 RepID=A0ABD4T5Q8_9CYAN|nr:hypothetical protein [Lyngbya confervoides]MCM1983885.1 hypothetical protein [Lyngbya confervoides BDU141951]